MTDVLIFKNVERQQLRLNYACKLLSEEGINISGNCISFAQETQWTQKHEEMCHASNIILVMWQGVPFVNDFIDKLKRFCLKEKKAFSMFSTTEKDIFASNMIEAECCYMVSKYLFYSGIENYKQLWRYLAAVVLKKNVQWQDAKPLPWHGICQYEELAALDNALAPAVGILVSRENWIWQEAAFLKPIVTGLINRGIRPIPVYCLWCNNDVQNAPGASAAVKEYFYKDGKCIVNAVINTFKVGMTMTARNEQDFLQRLNVPVLQGYNLLRTADDWEATLTGMTPVELSCNVVEPEFDGAIHGAVVSSKELNKNAFYEYAPIQERIDSLLDKVAKWTVLTYKANAEKRVAVIFHNYPPSNDNIGTAQGLDSPESVVRLLHAMAKAGYKLEHMPENGAALIKEITDGITNDRRFLSDEQLNKAVGRVTKKEYLEWYDKQCSSVKSIMEAEWGAAPGDVFNHDDSLIVPGIINGNVYIGVQSPRGFGEDPGKIIHSPTCPPPHHYFAFYHWLRNNWKADAVIHMGTHGSLEWLPGKNAGLSKKCYPDMALGDLPNIYPYYVTIVGEGIQAKRRSSACIISHLNPPSSQAGTYDDLEELEKLIEEYDRCRIENAASVPIIMEQIIDKSVEMHLDEELPRQDSTDGEYIGRLHVYLEQLKHMQIRTGLHIFGQNPVDDALVEYLLNMVRVANGKIPALPQVLANAYGYDYYELEEKSGEILPDGRLAGAVVDEIWSLCQKIIGCLASFSYAEKAVTVACSLKELRFLNTEISKESLRGVCEFICNELVPKFALTTQELKNTIRALEGEYIEPSPGGAPTSGRADILPTGRNFYGVNPNALPTKAAWQLGLQLGNQVIERFINEEGHYPESIGMVLWSESNMRTGGQCIAELLYLLGVKPVWQRGSMQVVDLEVIPLDELKRPRIDVTARISGLFRDTMAVAVELIEKAVQLVKELDESEDLNFIRKHVLDDIKDLEAQGVNHDEAARQAAYRIFGCPPGGYGAGVALMLEAKSWESIHDLADTYVRWGAHVYGSRDEGEYRPELFRKRLSTIEVTIKNIDNHEIHLLNSDDFNAYCGGLNAAVHSIRGKLPSCYIGDSADRDHSITKSLDEEFRRVIRGESMNTKYIEGMKKHGYKGASDLANLVTRAFGWDATSELMEDWIYEGFAEKLVFNKETREWMQSVNPWAFQRMTEKLLEAERRGMWKPKQQTKVELERLYLEIEGELEERSEG